MPKIVRDSGFTLVEVLAALAVFSIAIIGLTRAASQSTRSVALIEEKGFAAIVADNRLVEASILELQIGTVTGQAEQMSRTYEYELETTATPVEGLFEQTVRVRRENSGQVLIERTRLRTR